MLNYVLNRELSCTLLTDSSEGNRVALPGAYVEQMPYPCYESDRFTQAMEFVLPLTMIFAWLFPIAMTIRGIVREKEVNPPFPSPLYPLLPLPTFPPPLSSSTCKYTCPPSPTFTLSPLSNISLPTLPRSRRGSESS